MRYQEHEEVEDSELSTQGEGTKIEGDNEPLTYDNLVFFLYHTVKQGNADAIERLLDKGVDPNTYFSGYYLKEEETLGKVTPLHLIAQYGHTDCYDVLISNGANPLLLTGKNHSIVDLANLRHVRITQRNGHESDTDLNLETAKAIFEKRVDLNKSLEKLVLLMEGLLSDQELELGRDGDEGFFILKNMPYEVVFLEVIPHLLGVSYESSVAARQFALEVVENRLRRRGDSVEEKEGELEVAVEVSPEESLSAAGADLSNAVEPRYESLSGPAR